MYYICVAIAFRNTNADYANERTKNGHPEKPQSDRSRSCSPFFRAFAHVLSAGLIAFSRIVHIAQSVRTAPNENAEWRRATTL